MDEYKEEMLIFEKARLAELLLKTKLTDEQIKIVDEWCRD